jgi:hypothetical protein
VDGVLVRRRVGVFFMTIARYSLGLGMLPYATSKLERLQFQVSAWSYAQPLGELGGKTLLWATMGYSPRLQMFLGVLEFIPAVLLLVRRTRRVGALLMLPVAANVWVLNMGLDLWPATKAISGILLLLNLFLIAYDIHAYKRLFAELLTPSPPIGHPPLRLLGRSAAFIIPVALIGLFLATVERQVHSTQSSLATFTGERQINRAGTWRVAQCTIRGQATILPPEENLLYFDFTSRVETGTSDRPIVGHYSTNPKAHTVHIEKLKLAGSDSPIDAIYEATPTALKLTGTRNGQPIELVLEPKGWTLN